MVDMVKIKHWVWSLRAVGFARLITYSRCADKTSITPAVNAANWLRLLKRGAGFGQVDAKYIRSTFLAPHTRFFLEKTAL